MIVEKPKERPNNLVHMEPRRNRCSCRVRTTVSVIYAVDIDVPLKGREMGDWYFHDGVERVWGFISMAGDSHSYCNVALRFTLYLGRLIP